MPAIELNELTKRYGRSRGIENLSLCVEKGDIFGFIGPNGAGKSTTIRVLLNLIFPTSGSAFIFGMDVVRESKKIRQRLGYIPADASFYERMTVRQFLMYMARLSEKEDAASRIGFLCSYFDLDPGRKMVELSTGNKKKASIIQALVHAPELLILDEPTSGLDPLMQSKFFDLLREENRNGTTIFFSSHTLSEVQAFCKTVAIVRAGRVIKVEEIAALRQKQLKKVRLQFTNQNQAASFDFSGAAALHMDEAGMVSFLYAGEINLLIEKISQVSLDNVTIEEPSLEEIFLHYYRQEEAS